MCPMLGPRSSSSALWWNRCPLHRQESEQREKEGRKTEATCQPPLHADHSWRRCANSGSCANARNLAKKQRLGRLESPVTGTSYVRSSKRHPRRPRIPSRSAPDPTGVSQAHPQEIHLEAACHGTVAYVCLSHAFPSFNTTTLAPLCRAETGSHWAFANRRPIALTGINQWLTLVMLTWGFLRPTRMVS